MKQETKKTISQEQFAEMLASIKLAWDNSVTFARLLLKGWALPKDWTEITFVMFPRLDRARVFVRRRVHR